MRAGFTEGVTRAALSEHRGNGGRDAGYGPGMSESDVFEPDDGDRVIPPYEHTPDPEAPADDINREEPLPDEDRTVPPDYEDPTSPDDGLGTEEINPPDTAGARGVEADRDELAASDPNRQQENAGSSLDQPSEDVT